MLGFLTAGFLKGVHPPNTAVLRVLSQDAGVLDCRLPKGATSYQHCRMLRFLQLTTGYMKGVHPPNTAVLRVLSQDAGVLDCRLPKGITPGLLSGEIKKKMTVLVCGGGNGGHVTAGLSALHDDIETRVLTTSAERWTDVLKDNDLILSMNEGVGPHCKARAIRSKPKFIIKEPSQAVPGADLIILTVPAFAHQRYLETIEPYIEPNSTIVGLPGHPGFELQVYDILKDKANKCAIMSYESLPWLCRIEEFGKFVKILMVKANLMGSVIRGHSKPTCDPTKVLQKIIGKQPVLTEAHNHIEPILATKSIIHPPIMYGQWKDWDGKPLDTKPLFYQKVQTKYLCGVCDELIATAEAISSRRPEVDLSGVIHLYDWYLQACQPYFTDSSSLETVLQSNTAYEGMVHPMKQTEDGKFLPNFDHRFLTEDVPYGLFVTKGLAQLAGVPTPFHDEVLTWCQKMMGKEFIVGTVLNGRDPPSTRCLQRYGITTLENLLSIA